MTCSSETSVDSQRITWCYIPEDRNVPELLVFLFKAQQNFSRTECTAETIWLKSIASWESREIKRTLIVAMIDSD
jgi:hypothetical protein